MIITEGRNSFWLSIARCGSFSEEDNFIFRIWPKLFDKNAHVDCIPKFVDGRNLEDARLKAHRFIDKMFDEFYRPADLGLYGTPGNPARPIAAPPVAPQAPIDCDSLCVGGVVGEAAPETAQGMLLNLKDLV